MSNITNETTIGELEEAYVVTVPELGWDCVKGVFFTEEAAKDCVEEWEGMGYDAILHTHYL